MVRAQERYSLGTASFIVTADPAEITITSLSEKGITLQNNDNRILDLSRYQLISGKEKFRIPEDTSILPGRSVIFPPETTGLATTTRSMNLLYPNGQIAFAFEAATSAPVTQPEALEAGTTILRAVEIAEPKEPLHNHPTMIVPARTADPVGAGTRSSFHTLFAPFLRLASL